MLRSQLEVNLKKCRLSDSLCTYNRLLSLIYNFIQLFEEQFYNGNSQ